MSFVSILAKHLCYQGDEGWVVKQHSGMIWELSMDKEKKRWRIRKSLQYSFSNFIVKVTLSLINYSTVSFCYRKSIPFKGKVIPLFLFNREKNGWLVNENFNFSFALWMWIDVLRAFRNVYQAMLESFDEILVKLLRSYLRRSKNGSFCPRE